MKKFRFVLLALFACVLSMGISSCSDNDNNEEGSKVEAPAMLTFGFYAEDNAGILSKDYVATISTDKKINLSMPATIDKSSLVARFTTNEGNSVLVSGVTQQSQTTKNDFSAPVDYIVTNSNGTTNAKYTVTITKATDQTWKALADFAETQCYSGMVMKINPKDNVPYVAFGERGVETEKMWVLKLSDKKWVNVGGKAFSGVVKSSNYDFDIDADGTPYVAYGDAGTKPVAGALSVMKFADNAWSLVGEAGFASTQANNVSFAAFGNGKLVTAQKNNSAKASFARRALVVSNYTSSWNSSDALLSGKQIYATKLADNGSVAYMLVITANTYDGKKYGHYVYKSEDGATWTPLRENYVMANATQTSIIGYGITTSRDGQVYIWTGDDAAETGAYDMRLETYTDNSWTTVGGNVLPLGFKVGRHTKVSVAIAPDGTPFVLYADELDNNYPKVIYLDNETKQWSAPVTIANVEANDDLNIAFASTGIGYISFLDSENHIRSFVYE